MPEFPFQLSGRYEGEMTAPTPARYQLVLRVDVDSRYTNSLVMQRISGDLYQVNRTDLPGQPPVVSRVYLESWIVDVPVVTWDGSTAVIAGSVRFWNGGHAATDLVIRIPEDPSGVAGPAQVTLTQTGGISQGYNCVKRSSHFREVQLETDVCVSVNAPPILPSYDTHASLTRPPDLPQRTLDIAEAYREAGVEVRFNAAETTVVDDTGAEFHTWSSAELHDALMNHFSQARGDWPQWQLWGLLAGTYDQPSVAGIMFDAAAELGGAGKPPERQGFALFRKHSWFNDLTSGTPQTESQAQAARKFLYTWVHEAGHAFNLLHSWDKGRADALSWMNYDWRYDNRNGTNAFWSNFRFRFDDDELIHVRHGNRAAVIMGGDPWSSGMHLEAPRFNDAQLEGDSILEFLVRGPDYFAFMEPVILEVRLRNLHPILPIPVNKRFHPQDGAITVLIQRPDGETVGYDPITCRLAPPDLQWLKPLVGDTPQGEDRISDTISLDFGAGGFYFDQPGEYAVRAFYLGAGDMLLPSNTHRFRVGRPVTEEQDRLATRFFTHEVGLNLYFGGSRSPYLTQGLRVLEQFATSQNRLSAHAATMVASAFARPFYRIEATDEHPSRGKRKRVVQLHDADVRLATEISEPAIQFFQRQDDPSLNIGYAKLSRLRAHWKAQMGEFEEARREISQLRQDLQERGVNPPVIRSLEQLEQTLQA